jgi:hypothetical protein
VSNKPSSIKNWLIISSVALGVSGGCTLLFTQNLAQSALIGLATIPGVAASGIVRSRQQQRQLERQLERGRLRLHQLQQQGKVLNQQFDAKGKDCQKIELRVSQLHSLAANLTARTDLQQQAIDQLDRQLATLTLYCEEQQTFATKLDHKIQDKQVRKLEIDTKFSHLKLELAQVQAEQLQTQISNDRAKIVQSEIQAEIDRCSRIKWELEQQIAKQQTELRSSISAETQLVLQGKQAQLDELESKLIDQYNTIELYNRELKIAQLELSSRQAELDNLEFKIHTKRRTVDELDLAQSLQIFEPKPPIISRRIELNVAEGEWSDKFIDNPHLIVLQHIEKHGTITEAEASSKLGNARSVRQFANKLAEYTPDLPFSIRVESSPKGNRYLKETQN